MHYYLLRLCQAGGTSIGQLASVLEYITIMYSIEIELLDRMIWCA